MELKDVFGIWMDTQEREEKKCVVEDYMLDLLNKIAEVPKLSETARQTLIAEVYICHNVAMNIACPIIPIENDEGKVCISLTDTEIMTMARIISQHNERQHEVPIQETSILRYYVTVPKNRLFPRLAAAVFHT